MRQLKYNSASNVLRFEFPIEWKGEDITGVTLTIVDRDGVELLAADALTLYTATELDGAVNKFLKTVTLDSGATALEPGDSILIDGVAGPERHTVKGYNPVTYEATLNKILQNDHADEDAVYGLWGEITVDTTVVATFTLGLVCTLIWTPTGSGQQTTEAAQISGSVIQVEGLAKRLSEVFPRAYRSFTNPVDRMSGMLDESKMQCREELELSNLDFERIVDQDAVATMVLYKMAVLWTEGADEDLEDERKHLMGQYEKKKSIVLSRVLFVDQDQDTVEDAGETVDHQWMGGRGY